MPEPEKIRLIHTFDPDEHYPVSDSIRASLERYVKQKIRTGDFLYCCLAGDFYGAAARADTENADNLFNIAGYIYNHVPSIAYGTYEKVNAWLNREEK